MLRVPEAARNCGCIPVFWFWGWCEFRRTCAAANGTEKTDAKACRYLREVGIAYFSYPQFGSYGACAWMFRVPVYVPGGRLGRVPPVRLMLNCMVSLWVRPNGPMMVKKFDS